MLESKNLILPAFGKKPKCTPFETETTTLSECGPKSFPKISFIQLQSAVSPGFKDSYSL